MRHLAADDTDGPQAPASTELCRAGESAAWVFLCRFSRRCDAGLQACLWWLSWWSRFS